MDKEGRARGKLFCQGSFLVWEETQVLTTDYISTQFTQIDFFILLTYSSNDFDDAFCPMHFLKHGNEDLARKEYFETLVLWLTSFFSTAITHDIFRFCAPADKVFFDTFENEESF